MQDQQTDTYWSLMKGRALEGALKEEVLNELQVGEKMTWKEWRERHPDTKVLSVGHREDEGDAYGEYFTDEKGFRGLKANDDRLKTKAPIFAFRRGGQAFAIRHADAVDGATFAIPGAGELFLFRREGDKVFRSTNAWYSAVGFVREGQTWKEKDGGSEFNLKLRRFEGAGAEQVNGFDTYWYNWSLNNPSTEVLEPQPAHGNKVTNAPVKE